MTTKVTALFLAAVAAAYSAVVAYHVDPVTALWAGKARSDLGVGQRFAACYDTLVRAELFAGEKGAGGTYVATVKDWETGDPVAISNAAQQRISYSWVSFDTWTVSGAFVRGRSYSITFTRNGNDDSCRDDTEAI